MDYILDFPLGLRCELNDLSRKIQRIGKKVGTQQMLRHPDDFTNLSDELEEAAMVLSGLLERVKDVPRI